MKISIEGGNSLLLAGPASLAVMRGSGEVIGAPLKRGDRIVVREGIQLPFYFKRRSVVEVTLGKGATYERVEGGVIPPSWEEVAEEVARTRPRLTIVMGGVDSGKTTFCTYLANKLVEIAKPIAIIDGDIGQANIGAPATIGLGLIEKHLTDLFAVEAEELYFVGAISPGGALAQVLRGLSHMVKISKGKLTIVNTDGWIQGSDAKEYKLSIVRLFKPDVVVGLQREDELEPVLQEIEDECKVLRTEAPKTIRRRSRAERRLHRERGYRKFLADSKLRRFSVEEVEIVGNLFGFEKMMTPNEVQRYSETLRQRILYGEEGHGALFLITRGAVPRGGISELRREVGKEVAVIEGWPGGFLVGLLDDENRVLGLGVLTELDLARGTMRIYTPVEEGVARIQLSKLRLTREGRERMMTL